MSANIETIKNTVELIYKSAKPSVAIRPDVERWTEIALRNAPVEVADYFLFLFASDKGRVSGKVRMKGSTEEYPFSTTANDRTPIAVRNLWVPEQGHYKIPGVLEFLITEKTQADASLSIYTQGWIDRRGMEPH